MHAHTISPCAATSGGSTTAKPGDCDGSTECYPSDYSFQYGYWTVDDGTYGSFYGLALDGHVIYGPYNSDGEVWACDDLDVCNGFWLDDGAYAYASTTFYPYLVGCWGPGPTTHAHVPGCSTNACGDGAIILSLFTWIFAVSIAIFI